MSKDARELPPGANLQPRHRRWVPVAWVTLCLIWSSTWLAIKIGLNDLPPISFCALRFVIAAAVLFAICIGRYPLPRRLADYGFLAFTGIITFGVNYGLLFWGEQHVSSGLAAILQATIPTFGLFFAHFMLPSEPMRWPRMAGRAARARRRGADLPEAARFPRALGLLGRRGDCRSARSRWPT